MKNTLYSLTLSIESQLEALKQSLQETQSNKAKAAHPFSNLYGIWKGEGKFADSDFEKIKPNLHKFE